MDGDGQGGNKVKIGNQVGKACIDACVTAKMDDMSTDDGLINGVTEYGNPTTKGCWCNQKMTNIADDRHGLKTCFIIPYMKGTRKLTQPTNTYIFKKNSELGLSLSHKLLKYENLTKLW